MRVLLTETQSKLGRALLAALGREHDVRTPDGDPRDREAAAAAVRGCDAVVHLLPELRGRPLGRHSESDLIDAATRGTYNLLTQVAPGTRFVLVSSLGHFEYYPPLYRVTEHWAPRPTSFIGDLVPHLAELTVREVARAAPVQAVTLRLPTIVDDQDTQARPPEPDAYWLHVEDAVQGVERALAFLPPGAPQSGWWVFHIVPAGANTRFPLGLAGQPPFNYAPRHDFDFPPLWEATEPPVPSEPRRDPGGTARRVVIYGAGGPLAAAATATLEHDHVLRLCDLRPLAEAAAGPPQSPGAPLPRLLAPPHEEQRVDVTDPAQVAAAAADMDAIINCTVIRPHPVEAFRVNTLGAYHVMRAAVANGIRRVVQTGPEQVNWQHPAGYWYDFDLPADLPPRPGDRLYFISKYLGQEICRIFAEQFGLEVPTLLFGSFVNPANPAPRPLGTFPFSVTWEDAAQALRLALHAPFFPRPYEVFHIVADLPHGKVANRKAKQLLHWQPRDRLEAHWRRDLS